jgi:integrase
VYLTNVAFEICRKLVERNPTEKLFRNSAGTPWTTDAVNCALARIRIRIGKAIMQQRGLTIKDKEMEQFAQTLTKTCVVQGRELEKTPAQLQQEARRKLTNRLALSLVPNWSLYTLRHTWATRALQKGVDPLTAAILMGHSDPSMLSRVYQHLSLHPAHMLEQAKKAVQ